MTRSLLTRISHLHLRRLSVALQALWRIPLMAVMLPAVVLHAWVFTRHPEYLITQGFLNDDAFYSLKIARNMALGYGSTFDGLHLTNGYQPLWVWLMVPVYKFFPYDVHAPVRVAVVLLSLASLLSGVLLYRLILRLTKHRSAGLIGAAIWVLNPYLIKRALNGLESPIAVLFELGMLFVWIGPLDSGRRRDSMLSWVGWGMLVGMAFLVRVDLSLLAAVCFLAGLAVQRSLRYYVAGWIGAALAAAVIVSPWAWFSLTNFGSIVPLSGAAVRNWISFRSGETPPNQLLLMRPDAIARSVLAVFMVSPLWSFVKATTGLRPSAGAVAVAGVLGLAAAVVGGVKLLRKALIVFWQRFKQFHVLAFLYWLLVFGLYTFYLPAPWYFERYYLPLYALYAVYSGLAYSLLWAWIDDKRQSRRGRHALKVSTLLPLLAFLAFFPTWFVRHPDNGFYKAALWMRDNLPADARVGSYLAGYVGYFSERQVINLDGKVNPSSMKALMEGKVYDYILSENINYVADWPSYLRTLEARGGPVIGVDLRDPVYVDPTYHNYSVFPVQEP